MRILGVVSPNRPAVRLVRVERIDESGHLHLLWHVSLESMEFRKWLSQFGHLKPVEIANRAFRAGDLAVSLWYNPQEVCDYLHALTVDDWVRFGLTTELAVAVLLEALKVGQ